MSPRMFLLIVLSCLTGFATHAQKISVHPTGKAFRLDDVIEVEVDLGGRGNRWVSKPHAVESSNVEVEIVDSSTDDRMLFRILATPRRQGPASFGPVVFTGPDLGVVGEVPVMKFEILPPLDDGMASVEETLAAQRRQKRVAAVVRPEVRGDRSVDSLLTVEWVLFSDEPLNARMLAQLEIEGASVEGQSDFKYPTWTSAGSRMVHKRTVATFIVRPLVPGSLEAAPVWFSISADRATGHQPDSVRTRRLASLPPIEIAPRRTSEAIPVGSFEIDCPRQATHTAPYLVETSVTVRGDGDLRDTGLQLEGQTQDPFIFGSTSIEGPRIQDGRPRVEATYRIYATKVPASREHFSLPNVTFHYFDPLRNRKAALTCESRPLRLSRVVSQPRSKQRPEVKIPAQAMVVLTGFQTAGVIFVLLAAVGLVRAITRP